MKLDAPENPNYAASVVQVSSMIPLENSDNLLGLQFFGYQAIVNKDMDIQVGDLGILFTAESQLSEEYTRMNNLFRHSDLNNDETEQGYLEDSRRVRAIKLRGNRSDALFMPLSSLDYLGVDTSDLKVGDQFSGINGREIVRKYLIKQPGVARINKNSQPKFRRVDDKMLPLHFDTENYFRNRDQIPDDAEIIVTQKLHGSSVRIGNTVVKRKLSWLERLAKRVGIKVAETEYDHVYGSRKVVKDPNNPDQNHYYETSTGIDLWTEAGRKLDSVIPKGYLVYGELIGWTPDGSPIQKNYTYDLPNGQYELYVYRVATINPDGVVNDLSWDQVKKFTERAGIKHVPELWRGTHDEFVAEEWMDIGYGVEYVKSPGFYAERPVPLSDANSVDEGVVIRTDVGAAPYLLKAKSPVFLAHETKMLDQEVVDIESEQS